MKVLVTGNLGYIGPVVVKHLKAAGHYVIGLDTGWFLPNYASLPEWPDEQFYFDMRKGLPVTPDRFDAVVHLAGLSNDPMGDLDPALTQDINVLGTVKIATHCTLHTRHIVVSSCSVYGTAEMATEDTATNPLTAYARAKVLVDQMFASMNSVSLRLGTVYGYSPGHRLDLVVNRMVYDAVYGHGVHVNGNAARPLVHVEDVARAVVFMLDRPETGVFNVVGDNLRMEALALKVSAATGGQIIHEPSNVDARDYMADGSKIAALGWRPRFGIDGLGTLPRLVAQSFALGDDPERYVRLNALRNLIDSGVLTSDLRRKVAA